MACFRGFDDPAETFSKTIVFENEVFIYKILRLLHNAAHSIGGVNKIKVKNRITVNLEDSEFQTLQRLATDVDRSLAWLGRQAIRDFLQRERVSEQLTLRLATEDMSDKKHTSQ